MTRDEAAQLLNLGENVNPTQVRQRYQELYSEYQVRLTNAPTANLKKLYQRNLQQLEEAAKVLSSGLEINSYEDLPAAEPSYTLPRVENPVDKGRSARPTTQDPSLSRGNGPSESRELIHTGWVPWPRSQHTSSTVIGL